MKKLSYRKPEIVASRKQTGTAVASLICACIEQPDGNCSTIWS